MAKPYVKRDVNDTGTWAYPYIPSGVTVIRKKNVTEDEIYGIYKDCINIQRTAYLRMMKQKINSIQPKESMV